MGNSDKLLQAIEFAVQEYCITGFTNIAFGNSVDVALNSAEQLNEDLLPVRKLIDYLKGKPILVDNPVFYKALRIIQQAHSRAIKRYKFAEKSANNLQERLQSLSEFEVMKNKFSYIYSELDSLTVIKGVA